MTAPNRALRAPLPSLHLPLLLLLLLLFCCNSSRTAADAAGTSMVEVADESGLAEAIVISNNLTAQLSMEEVVVRLKRSITLSKELPALEGGKIRIIGECGGGKNRCVLDGGDAFPLFVVPSLLFDNFRYCAVAFENVVVRRMRNGVLQGWCSFHASRSDFVANTAVTGGGAVINNGPVAPEEGPELEWSATVRIRRCNFRDNMARAGHGGVLASQYQGWAMSYWVDVARSTFHNNSAALGDGGALYLGNAFDKLYLRDVTFDRNVAADDGGAIYTVGDELKAIEVRFTANAALAGFGGAVAMNKTNQYFDENVAAHFCRCRFQRNKAAAANTSSRNVLLRLRNDAAGETTLRFCPRVVAGVLVLKPDGSTLASSTLPSRSCTGCTGCDGDCHGNGQCRLTNNADPVCRCNRGYDPAAACSRCRPFRSSSSACRRCVPGFVEKGEGCRECKGLREIPYLSDPSSSEYANSTTALASDDCAAKFRQYNDAQTKNGAGIANVWAYFDRDASKGCRRRCLFFRAPNTGVLCSTGGTVKYVRRRRLFFYGSKAGCSASG